MARSAASSAGGLSVRAGLKALKYPIAVLFCLGLVSNLLMLTGSIFMLQVYDRVLPSRSLPTLVALAGLVVGLYVLYAAVDWLRLRMTARLGELFGERFAIPVYQAAVSQRHNPALRKSDLVRDLDAVRSFISGQASISLMDLPWIPVYLCLAFLLHPLLGWISIGGGVVMAVLLVGNEVLQQRPTARMSESLVGRQVLGEESRAEADTITAMGMLTPLSARWQQQSARLSAAQRDAADRTAFYSSATRAFRLLLQSAVLATGAFLVIEGQLTAGMMIAASIMTSRSLAPVEQVVGSWRSYVAGRQSWARLKQLPRFAAPEQRSVLEAPRQSLKVTQLLVQPEGAAKPVLAGINFELQTGDCLGVLGLSGSGKTTLARTLVGVVAARAGDIRLDGSELHHFDPDLLGGSVGYLPQNVQLLDGTIAENISRFQPDAPTDEILKAAGSARIHYLIAGLENGYETRVGSQGLMLSAGQRQRIGLARALYGSPFLLVLDEPNSNLDADGDAALTDALMKARARGAIAIVVAHRPSAIAAANKLLFLENGQQRAFGLKEEVLSQITSGQQVAAAVPQANPRRANG